MLMVLLKDYLGEYLETLVGIFGHAAVAATIFSSNLATGGWFPFKSERNWE